MRWKVSGLINNRLTVTTVRSVNIRVNFSEGSWSAGKTRSRGYEHWHGMFGETGIEGLHPRSPRNFASQPSARVSHTLRSSYHSHMTAAAT
jgi:hypothetical protein